MSKFSSSISLDLIPISGFESSVFLLPGYLLGYIWRGPSLWFDDLPVLPLEESSRDGALLGHVSSLHDVEQRGQVAALLGGCLQ